MKWNCAAVSRPLNSVSKITGPMGPVGKQDVLSDNNSCYIVRPGVVTAIMDDSYALGPPAAVFAASDQLSTDLAKVGLALQPAKSCCYTAEAHRSDSWHELRGDVPEGVLKSGDTAVLVDGRRLHGLSVCNVPVGSPGYVQGYLAQRLAKIKSGFGKASQLLDPGRWPHPEIPARQMLWILTLVCFQSM